jgi:hypothetical protein
LIGARALGVPKFWSPREQLKIVPFLVPAVQNTIFSVGCLIQSIKK